MIQQELLQLTDIPPDKALYAPITPFDTIMLYGVQIQSAYDHARIQIQEKFSPIRVQIDDSYFYGFAIES